MKFKARRIKFKVFDRCHQESHIVGEQHHDHMVCGQYEDMEVFYSNYQTGEGSLTYDEELPTDNSGYILMQYTGFETITDNVELYEYDIIRCGDAIGLIYFKNGMWQIMWEKEYDSYRNDLYFWTAYRPIYYVGNYFENPELRKIFNEINI